MKIILSSKAKFSLREIYHYIAKDNRIAARQQIEFVYNHIDLIKRNPNIGIIGRVDDTRELFIHNTNYFIVYQVNETSIIIVNIIHTSRDY